MSFASDITDARQLPPQCSCAANTPTYPTTRRDRYSYEKRYRIERACLASQTNKFELFELCIDNTGASGYAVGDYIQVAYGTPALLVYITGVLEGEITNITIVNRPLFDSVPPANIPSKTLSGNGTGAIFSISVAPNRARCCNCGSSAGDTSCSGTNISEITYSEEPVEAPRNC